MNRWMKILLLALVLLPLAGGWLRAMDAGVGATFAPDLPVAKGSSAGATQLKDHLVVVLVNSYGTTNGLQVGDQVTEIDGDAVSGRTAKEAVDDINGFYDSTVALTVKRKGEVQPLTITVTRHDPHLSAAAAAH